MKVTVLVENTTCSSNHNGMQAEHGLSLHIDTGSKRILFDVGQSDLFTRNAKKLGIDISAVDTLLISHGHKDHGGGLKHFFKENTKAQVYLHQLAGEDYYTRLLGFIPYYIGLDKKLLQANKDRVHFIGGDQELPGIGQVLTGFPHDFPQPESNLSLFKKEDKKWRQDNFQHEILLILKDKGKNVVFSACSHSGVVNMMNRTKRAVEDESITAVFGGFHIYNPVTKRNEPKAYIDHLANELKQYDTVFYTGHCTGRHNVDYLTQKLGAKIKAINSGDVIEL